ncbi:penicillin-binding protein 2 [Akkermansia sp. N21169]|uniref:peptidoglycan D,D-transpeptidase FtsI family protein n=1 Tax=Akkermansia sp. N21169 TaxID=3040765 RepID=UPI00244EC748|nr:penicillin-binding protein 2 [Akkermansia sp. N21169]
MKLVDIQIVHASDNGPYYGRRLAEIEEFPARRGLIMDSQEEVLTTNVQTSELVADVYHLNDPRLITWGLAYSKAVHSDKWATLDEAGREKLVSKYRSRLLAQAATKKDGDPEYKLAQLLLSDDSKANSIVKAEDVKTTIHERLEKLYDCDIAESYIREHMSYAAAVIAPFLEGVTYEELFAKLRQDNVGKQQMRLVIAQNLPEEKAELIKQALQDARVQGFKCETIWKRVYVAPTCLTHILGYVGQLTEGSPLLNGVAGLEKTMDPYLVGQKGFRESRRNNRGQIIPSKDDRFKPPVDGLNIKLTINMELQTIVEEELDKGLAYYHAPRGTIIVVEPHTGNILAMASRPQFNLNTKENMQEGALNFAVQGLYEPGSTFKLVSVTSAVDTGKLTFNSMIDCSTAPVPGSKPVSDAPRHYGMLSVADVLKKSSNPGAFRIGCRAGGWNVYKKYLEAFGFRKKTGIELPSEAQSQCQDGNNFSNFSRITYGYSVMVTPLQVAMAYAAVANGGVLMKPRLVDVIYDSDGTIVERRQPEEVRRVMKESTSRAMRDALARVAGEGGTAHRGNVPGYQIGGKTGTAHKVKEHGGYYDNRYTVSFVGLLPAADPAFVCLVVVDDPHPTDCHPGGGTVCAPIFKNVAGRLAAALNVPQTTPIQGTGRMARTDAPPATPAVTPPPVKKRQLKKTVASSNRKKVKKTLSPSPRTKKRSA